MMTTENPHPMVQFNKFAGKQLSAWLAVFVPFAVCFILSPEPAKADFRLCNDTKSRVGVSLGYREKDKWTTEGWWQIPADTCASLLEGKLSSRFYYIYAEDADQGGQWRGDVFMCTDNREFRINGVQECFARGYQKTGFFEVDTGNKDSWMVRLTEAGQTGSSK